MRKRTKTRRQSGNYIAEFGPALWVLIIAVFFPMLDMLCLTLNTGLINNAVQVAAQSACRCKTFSVNSSVNDLSCKQQAAATFQQLASQIVGYTYNSNNVQTYIVVTNITSGAVTTQSTPLAQPADTSVNTYAIKVTATGQLNPLWTAGSEYFGSVPGLTAPITYTSASSVFCESPQGLNQ